MAQAITTSALKLTGPNDVPFDCSIDLAHMVDKTQTKECSEICPRLKEMADDSTTKVDWASYKKHFEDDCTAPALRYKGFGTKSMAEGDKREGFGWEFDLHSDLIAPRST